MESKPRQPGPLRIVIAEDSSSDSFLIRRGLAAFQEHCEIKRVSDGDALLQQLGLPNPDTPDWLPDLILIDLYLPKLYGLQALRLIKREPRFADIPCVMISSLATASDRREATRLGAAAFIDKPLSVTDFRASLRAIETLLVARGMTCEPPRGARNRLDRLG